MENHGTITYQKKGTRIILFLFCLRGTRGEEGVLYNAKTGETIQPNQENYEKEKKDIIAKIKTTPDKWDISELKGQYLLTYKPFFDEWIEEKEDGKLSVAEKGCGKVHWLNGFTYQEEIEIREMYKQHRNNKLKNFSH